MNLDWDEKKWYGLTRSDDSGYKMIFYFLDVEVANIVFIW